MWVRAVVVQSAHVLLVVVNIPLANSEQDVSPFMAKIAMPQCAGRRIIDRGVTHTHRDSDQGHMAISSAAVRCEGLLLVCTTRVLPAPATVGTCV